MARARLSGPCSSRYTVRLLHWWPFTGGQEGGQRCHLLQRAEGGSKARLAAQPRGAKRSAPGLPGGRARACGKALLRRRHSACTSACPVRNTRMPPAGRVRPVHLPRSRHGLSNDHGPGSALRAGAQGRNHQTRRHGRAPGSHFRDCPGDRERGTQSTTCTELTAAPCTIARGGRRPAPINRWTDKQPGPYTQWNVIQA